MAVAAGWGAGSWAMISLGGANFTAVASPTADAFGVAVAFDDPTLEPTPTWTRLDSTDNLVASWSIDRGRSYELDKVATGTATVQLNDVGGLFDPTNASGPYYGNIEPLKQATIALQNPVTGAWTTLFRGFVESYDYELDASEKLLRTGLRLVDGFDILSAIEMTPGEYGSVPPAESAGDVYYARKNVNLRIAEALSDAGWPTEMQTIFTGNVELAPTVYSTGSQLLSVIQDAADAEFPGVANVYMSKTGILTFHGRYARFHPDNVSYDIGHWKCGDGAAVRDSPTNRAQIRALQFERGKDKIINSASASPQGIAEEFSYLQLREDEDSIAAYGKRSWSADNLVLWGGIETNEDSSTSEAMLFSEYYRDNYKDPRTRVSQVTFRSIPPSDPRAAATWRLICGVELGDLLEIRTTHPGGGGFNDDYYIEGIHYDVKPLNRSYHDVTLTLDVSPRAYFLGNPFEA